MAALVEEDWSEVDDFLYCARRLLRYSSRPGHAHVRRTITFSPYWSCCPGKLFLESRNHF